MPRVKISCLLLLVFFANIMSASLKEGIYRGVLVLHDNPRVELPFNFRVQKAKGKYLMYIFNAEEKILVDDITVKKDSVIISMPVFDTEFRCRITKNGMEGNWINHYRSTNNIIPFFAEPGKTFRFESSAPAGPPEPLPERWEVTFSPGSAESTKALGLFTRIEGTEQLRGTFLTETGDYRYLEGLAKNGEIFLSAFDGSHAYLFRGKIDHTKISGQFFSGSHWSEPWTAVANNNFELHDAESITVVRDPSRPLKFTLKSLAGGTLSLSDPPFAGQPVVVQLMGSWCPNCMDESRYLVTLYERYRSQGLQMVALAFEKTRDEDLSRRQLNKMKERLGIPYPILLTLETGKDKASEMFDNLNAVSAFPTLLFLDRQHRVVKVHTGFSGPATGAEYEKLKLRTENLIKTLLQG